MNRVFSRELLTRSGAPFPASYWVTAGISSVAVFTCYLTAWWVPAFAVDWVYTSIPSTGVVGPGTWMVFGGACTGLLMAGLPFLALRWPWAAIGLALTPLIPTLLDSTLLHFGVIAALCAVALTAGWRTPVASLVAVGAAASTVVFWLSSRRGMAAPFRAEIQHDNLLHESVWPLALSYALGMALVLALAAGLRWSAQGELERRALAARSGEVEEQSAVVAERARLARDLHDVVAHHVSLIAVRAETAPFTHPQIGDEARGVLGDIAADARLALDELRGVLGILGRAGSAERAPQPTWSDIGALVERTRSTGADVEVIGDTAAEVGPSAGYAAYRVVQEALTNARKHAPGAPVTLDLEATSQLLTVQVSTPLGEKPAAQGTGQGLVGMRERVEALGGRLLSGPVGDHFVVEAILPRGLSEGAA